MNIEREFHELKAVIEKAGAHALEYFEQNRTASSGKADGSDVTPADEAVEKEIVAYIKEKFPEDSIIGEEGGNIDGTSDFVWHIDPIDGTDNFMRRIPFCAVSVARLGPTQEDSLGIVHNPITKQTFSSLMEAGVYEKEHVHEINDQKLGSRYCFSVSRGREPWMKGAAFNIIKGLAMEFGKGTAYGSCALELAYVAANRIDGQLIFGLHSYDWAAGLYLVRAGGGTISIFEHGEWREWTDSLKELCSTHDRVIFASHAGVQKAATVYIGNPQQWAD
jgi:myo-inositol-1(or 4)-monophosphatase